MALAYGDTGAGVETLQAQLRGLGYALDVDGVFGAQTHDAVTHFQQSMRIGVDGKVGDQTLTALYRATGQGWRTPNAQPWTSPEAIEQGDTATPYQPPGGAAPKGKIPGVVWLGVIAGVAYLLYKNGVFGKLDGVEQDDDDGDEEK